MDTPAREEARQLGYWALALSIALGALLLGVFQPVFLLVVLAMLLWIALIFSRAQANQRRLADGIERWRCAAGEHARRIELLGGLINAADIPILATDEQGCIAHTNRHAQRVLGVSKGILGRRFDEIMTQGALQELEALARAGEPGHARLALSIRGEIREFDVSADPIPISGGAVLTFRDITELSRAMTLKADFVANASHELRTPIASIKAAAETLNGSARDDQRMASRLIGMIFSNAMRLEMLASDLLDLSRVEAEDQPPDIEPVDPGELIGRILAEFAPASARRDLTLVAEIEPGLGPILTDPKLLSLILRNLVQNAVKFAHEHTRIRVGVKREPLAPDRTAPIPIELVHPQGIVLRVVDKGVGIPLSHQQRVFERFYQVDDARTGSGASRGTGLGLAIVKHAARRLGGSVHIESVYQSGTTVTIGLPRCATERSVGPGAE